MEVQIGDLQSTVRAVDGDALLSPQTMEKIVRVVLASGERSRSASSTRTRRAAHHQRC